MAPPSALREPDLANVVLLDRVGFRAPVKHQSIEVVLWRSLTSLSTTATSAAQWKIPVTPPSDGDAQPFMLFMLFMLDFLLLHIRLLLL